MQGNQGTEPSLTEFKGEHGSVSPLIHLLQTTCRKCNSILMLDRGVCILCLLLALLCSVPLRSTSFPMSYMQCRNATFTRRERTEVRLSPTFVTDILCTRTQCLFSPYPHQPTHQRFLSVRYSSFLRRYTSVKIKDIVTIVLLTSLWRQRDGLKAVHSPRNSSC